MARWDIFCSVVDNYGDIGVTWRLARQLVAEHGQQVRLWVDEPRAFVPLCPGADPLAARQWQQDVEVCRWGEPWAAVEPAEVVVEAFACRLPAAYEAALGACRPLPLWVNLEYLSAEDWVEDCHGLASPQANGLAKYFWFPGFTARTGGLLRERELLVRRDAWQADAEGRRAFLAGLGVEWRGERLVSLFAYEQPRLDAWLELLAAGEPTLLLVPEGRVLGDVRRWAGEDLACGALCTRGALTVRVIPFVSQDDYDRLLWSCDLNAVRGEDSFVRAQWAGRPFIWHIYPQEESAHLDKLEAFMARYLATAEPALAQALRDLWRTWNAAPEADASLAASWAQLQAQAADWQRHARSWCAELASRPDLATGLVLFYTGSLE